jgi:Tfp pilus assembly protein PilO
MTRSRQWTLMAAVVMVLIVVVGWFVAISPQRSHAASLRQQAAAGEQQTQKLQLDIKRLSSQISSVADVQNRIGIIQSKLPLTPNLATYVRQLTAAATSARVDLTSVAPGTPAPVKAASAAPVAAPAVTAGATPAPARAPAVVEPALQTIPLILSVTGDYLAIQQFLSRLEALQRVSLVTAISLVPGAPLTAGTAPAANTTAAWRTLQGQITVAIFESGPVTPVALPGSAAPSAGASTSPSAAPSAAPSASAN